MTASHESGAVGATRHPGKGSILAAFMAVYTIWGSTYLAIRYAIESIPPLLMAGSRFLIAGILIYAVARLHGASKPTPRMWFTSAVVGAGLVACGNGGVTVAEKFIPSGVTGLMIASVPIYMALFGWLAGLERRPTKLVWSGLLGGTAGVGLLLQGFDITSTSAILSSRTVIGLLILLATSLIWSVCSLYSRVGFQSPSPFLAAGQQMICGSTILMATAMLVGEQHFDFRQLTRSSLIAFTYLVVCGSLIAFPAYVFLLHHCHPAKVSTYAYVNPVIAVILGATIGQERLTLPMIAGGILIVLSVVVVITGQQLVTRKRNDGAGAQQLLQSASVRTAGRG